MTKKTNAPAEKIVSTIESTPESEIVSPVLTDDEQIVSWNAELSQLVKDLAISRAEFVTQTDKQIAKIAELDAKIESKQDILNTISDLEIELPARQKEISDARNEAWKIKWQMEASIADIEKRELAIAKTTAQLNEQKSEQDARELAQNTQAETHDKRAKELDKIEKAQSGLKTALWIK